MQEKRFPILAVTCDANSDLVQNADISMTFPFVTELSVVMTSSFSTLLLGLVYIAFLLGEKNGRENHLLQIIEKSSQVMKDHEQTLYTLVKDPTYDNHYE